MRTIRVSFEIETEVEELKILRWLKKSLAKVSVINYMYSSEVRDEDHLGYRQQFILQFLEDQPGRTMREIANFAQITPPTVHRVMARLGDRVVRNKVKGVYRYYLADSFSDASR